MKLRKQKMELGNFIAIIYLLIILSVIRLCIGQKKRNNILTSVKEGSLFHSKRKEENMKIITKKNKQWMKQMMFSFIMMGIFVFFSFAGQTVKAETFDNAKKLKAGQSYYFDLDQDGKKETIQFKKKRINDDEKEMSLYVNKKIVYKAKEYGDWNCYVMDINKKDKHLDLMFLATGNSQYISHLSFAYYKDGKIVERKQDKYWEDCPFGFGEAFKTKEMKIKTDGKGTVMLPLDTYFYLPSLQKYVAYVGFQVKDNTIQQKKMKSYPLIYGKGAQSGLKNKQYKLNRSCYLYDTASKNGKKLRMLKKDETITIEAILPNQKNRETNRYEKMTAYAYIKDKNGKYGWIYLDSKSPYDGGVLKETDVWG